MTSTEWGVSSLLLAAHCSPCGFHVWLMASVCYTPSFPLFVCLCPLSFPLFPNHTPSFPLLPPLLFPLGLNFSSSSSSLYLWFPDYVMFVLPLSLSIFPSLICEPPPSIHSSLCLSAAWFLFNTLIFSTLQRHLLKQRHSFFFFFEKLFEVIRFITHHSS